MTDLDATTTGTETATTTAPAGPAASAPETDRGARRRVVLTVNGEPRHVEVEARTLLADSLRHELGLTGTHVGCEQGACGACTILIDGDPMRSCLVLTPQAEGRAIETVESLTASRTGRGAVDPGDLHPVQQAMRSAHGLQCGFCTPGIVVSLVAAHRRGAPVDEVIDDVLDGHLCRCTGYVNIRAAVRAAWSALDGADVDAGAEAEADAGAGADDGAAVAP